MKPASKRSAPCAVHSQNSHSHLELEPYPPAHRTPNHSLPLVAQIVCAKIEGGQHPVDLEGVRERDAGCIVLTAQVDRSGDRAVAAQVEGGQHLVAP